MSGIVGIFNRDNSFVVHKDLQKMVATLSHRGPDDSGIWCNGEVGLGHTMLWTTPESVHERLPLANKRGNFVLTADIRLDNREELLHILGLSEGKGDLIGDSELLLAAYEKWGNDCPSKLHGDFAFAIWDTQKRQLFCVRDRLGVKQFYYYMTHSRFIFANDLLALLSIVPNPHLLNKPYLLEILADNYERAYAETVYKEIHKLCPAHILQISQDKVHESQYHNFDVCAELYYKSDAEYIEHFCEIFVRSIACRTRAIEPLGFQVSGGLDSSSIVSVARNLVERDTISLRNGKLYSYMSREFVNADEREFVHALRDYCYPWPTNILNFDQMWSLKDYEKDQGFPPPEPEISLLRRATLDLMKSARDSGCRILLNGHGGDQVLLGDSYYTFHFLPRVSIYDLLAELPFFIRKNKPKTIRVLFVELIKTMLRCFIPEKQWSVLRVLSQKYNGWSQKPYGIQTNTQMLLSTAKKARFSKNSQIFPSLLSGHFQKLIADLDYYGGQTQIENWYPYLDVRLVHFLSSLPIRFLFRQGTNKWILRQSMINVLPEPIRTRTSYGVCDDIVHLGWRIKEKNKIQRLLEQAQTVEYGWIDEQSLHQAWQRYWDEEDSYLWVLNNWLNVELWLQMTFQSVSHNKPQE